METLANRGYSRWDVFNDWLDLMLYALQRDDDQYLDIVDEYDNDRSEGERDIDLYTEAFGQLQRGMAETDADLLGEVYERFGQTSDHFGQYFTPHNLSAAMAEMNLGDVEVDPEREDPYTVLDPACGSGRLLVEAAKRVDGPAVYVGQDKDATCAKMTALNLCFFNVDGYAVVGDSLKMERRRVWATRYTPLGGEVRELDADEFDDPYQDVVQDNGQEPDEQAEDEADDPEETEDAMNLRETTLSDFQEGGS